MQETLKSTQVRSTGLRLRDALTSISGDLNTGSTRICKAMGARDIIYIC